MLNLSTGLGFSLLLLSCPLWAQWQPRITAASDFVWRGVSQTDEDPVLQPMALYTSPLKLYLGIWASNVKFNKENELEVDAWLGYTDQLDSGFNYDLGYVHYFYDGGNDIEFGEFYLQLGFRGISAKYSYDSDNRNGYLEANGAFAVHEKLELRLHAGQYDFKAGNDYVDWRLGLAWKFAENWEFEVAYTDTDLDGPDVAEARGVLSVVKTW